jgi:3-dehydroquinate dehydratase / shikimate dehydrogenase
MLTVRLAAACYGSRVPPEPKSTHRRMLAVAFGPATMAEALAGLPAIRAQADCVELRLDLFEETVDVDALMRERGELIVVATLRPPNQGGKSLLHADERLQVLLRAAELGAEYVDLEYDAATPAAIAALRGAGARVVVSRHDFSAMPADLADGWWPQLAAIGADVVKVVATADDVRDCLQIFRAFKRASQPTIAIAMGAAGLPTRLLAFREEQCLLSYAALDAKTGTAPGQVTAREMHEVYGVGRLGPATRVFGLLGPHVEIDRLTEYNAWLARDNCDGIAVPFPATGEAAAIVNAFRELPVSGWHVHRPDLQQDVSKAMDHVTPRADAQRKVNSIVRRADGTLLGDWVETPAEQYALWLGAL